MPVHNKHHNTAPVGSIYIGRGSKWGNPFVIGKHGDRADVIRLYKEALDGDIARGHLSAEEMATLHEKDLVCYCSPAKCHGDVLLKYAKDAHDFLESADEAFGG